MKTLNNNVLLKLKPKEINNLGIINSSKESSELIEFLVEDCELLEKGTMVLIRKYDAIKWKDDLYIAPYSSIKLCINNI